MPGRPEADLVTGSENDVLTTHGYPIAASRSCDLEPDPTRGREAFPPGSREPQKNTALYSVR
jgi:hypothetical protein